MNPQADALAFHHEALRLAKDRGISYADARNRLVAVEQLKGARAMAPHFHALTILRSEGITERSPNFATRYGTALAAVKREREPKAIAAPALRLVAAPSMPMRHQPVAARAVAPDASNSTIPRGLKTAVQTLRSVTSYPLTEQQTAAYHTFCASKPMTFKGGSALINGIADLANKKDKVAAIANIKAAADFILAAPYGGHAA
jgi:hypothetical protein